MSTSPRSLIRRLVAAAFALLVLTSAPVPTPAAPADEATRRLRPDPPQARRIPHRLEKHGHVRIDDWYWLKERDDPAVRAYLEAENAYLEAATAHTRALQESLYGEIVGRIQEDDATVPVRKGDFWYLVRWVEGGEYAVHCRRRGGPDGAEETILDGNALGRGHGYFALAGVVPSPDHTRLAYAADTVGRRQYTLRFRDLETGRTLADSIPGVTGNHVWAADSRTVFYTRQDPETLRWDRIYRHRLGSDPSADVLVYEEPDAEFSVALRKTRSQRYILIECEQTLATEVRWLDAADPSGAFAVFLPRRAGHEYWIDHHGDGFVVRTNHGAKNFRLVQAPLRGGEADWRELVPHRADVFVEDFAVFRDHLVVEERRDGLLRLRIVPWQGGGEHEIDFGEPAYLARSSDNFEYDTGVLRYVYTSLTTPLSTIDYDMNTRQKTLRREEPVLGGFDKRNYCTERLFAPAPDGTRIPISLVYRIGTELDGSHPLLLYGYGSYGASRDATFQSERLSLLDRGFVFAIAHVRGGQEMGRDWYEHGKLMHKMNTFTDFIACGRWLVDHGYTSPDRLFAVGGSAGGLLMGAVANLAPDLFAGIVSHVPFVDVVTTMLDPDIPLTTSEYDEWGDPNEKPAYDYMLAYSPYDRITAQRYPAMLVTTGLHDSQVQYWEPAKYVAKLRALKTDGNLLLLKTNMEAGHGGVSGRFRRHRDTALAYAFLLDLAEAARASPGANAGGTTQRPR